jgi:hypothetical protein
MCDLELRNETLKEKAETDKVCPFRFWNCSARTG